MSVIIIKHFFIVLCSIWTYIKLMNIQLTSKSKITIRTFLYALAVSVGVYFVRFFSILISIYFMIVLSVIFDKSIFKRALSESITGTIISFGTVYCAFEIGALLVSLLEGYCIFFTDLRPQKWILAILLGLIQSMLLYILFSLKRLKNGMPFLMDYCSSELGIYICVSLLISIAVLGTHENSNLTYVIPAVFIFIAGMILWFWWRTRMTKEYMNRLREQEVNALKKDISEHESEIARLKRENDELSKIIHRDNKLIPALELSVREYLTSVSGSTPDATSNAKTQTILQQLDKVSQERAGIVKGHERQSKKLPATDIASLDMMLSYLQSKGTSFDVNFDLTITCNVQYLVEHYIDEQDLRTLLADLIDNAIIAAKAASHRNVFVNFAILCNTYFIDVFDSGIPFEVSTLIDVGRKAASTHLDDGGSGIGLMSTFELCKKHDISFEITEFSDNSLYVKKVSLCFDGLGEYRIKTPRVDEIMAATQRDDIHIYSRVPFD